MVDKNKNGIPDDEEDASAPDKKTGLLGKVWNTVTSPLKLFGGLGGIIKLAAVAIGSYFLLGSEKVQHWLGGIFGEKFENGLSKFMNKIKAMFGSKEGQAEVFNDMDVDDAQKHLKGKIPDSVYEIITESKETWDKFHNAVKDANGGKITDLDTQITNEKSIVRLMTCEPDLTVRIIKALPKGSTSIMGAQVATSLKAMVKDGSFDALLANDQNRAAIIKVLVGVIPPEKLVLAGIKLDAAKLDAAIVNDLKANNGKLSKDMRTLFEAKIDETLGTTTTSPDGKSPTPTANPEPNLLLSQAATLLGPTNQPVVDRLRKEMGDENFKQFAIAIATGNGDGPVLAMRPDNVKPVLTFAKYVDITAIANPEIRGRILELREAGANPQYQRALTNLAAKNINPADLFARCFAEYDQQGNIKIGADGAPTTPSASLILARLMNPAINAEITKAGAADLSVVIAAHAPKFKETFTENNLNAILNATRSMGHNVVNATNGSQLVMSAFAEMVVNHNAEVFRQVQIMKPSMISDFLKNDANAEAFTTLVKTLKIKGEDGKLLTEIQNDWGDKDEGLLEVLRSKSATESLPSLLAGESYSPGAWQGFLDWSGIGSSDVIVQNKTMLKRLAATVKEVAPDTPKAPASVTNMQEMAANNPSVNTTASVSL